MVNPGGCARPDPICFVSGALRAQSHNNYKTSRGCGEAQPERTRPVRSMTVLTLALILLGAVAVALAVALVQRAREDPPAARTRRTRAGRGRPERRSRRATVTPHAAAGSATDIAEGVDRLIERLQQQSTARDEREGIYRRLLGTMHEAMLVERDGIELANARFAELCGVANPAKLVGRRLSRTGPCRILRTRRRVPAPAPRWRVRAGATGSRPQAQWRD